MTTPHRERRRPAPLARLLAISTAVALLSAGALTAVSPTAAAAVSPTAAAAPQTVVSLTFDDGKANQLAALPALKAKGMKATFYVVSGYVGATDYMTRANLDQLAAAGHEIGGHTVNHPDLASLSAAEAKRQICTDRATLSSWGFAVRSFAYPFASSNPAAQQAAQDCGYRSARLLGDLESRFGCAGCGFTETLPPAAPFATRALDQFDSTWTLADLKRGVTNAETTGGWVQFTFHDVCATACSDISITPTLLNQFLTWLKPRATTNNTVVKTVGDAVGTAAAPVVAAPAVPPAAAGVNGIKNPGLETVVAGQNPTCWMQGGWGQNTAAFSTGTPAHTGNVSSRIDMTGYASGDAKLIPQFDLGDCAPSVVAGHTYSLRSWYLATGVTQYAVYLRNSIGAWSYWTSSPWLPASATYVEGVWTTPAIPAGYTGISFALTVFGNGTLRTDDIALYDTVGAPLTFAALTPIPGPLSKQSAVVPSPLIEVFTANESSAGE